MTKKGEKTTLPSEAGTNVAVPHALVPSIQVLFEPPGKVLRVDVVVYHEAVLNQLFRFVQTLLAHVAADIPNRRLVSISRGFDGPSQWGSRWFIHAGSDSQRNGADSEGLALNGRADNQPTKSPTRNRISDKKHPRFFLCVFVWWWWRRRMIAFERS